MSVTLADAPPLCRVESGGSEGLRGGPGCEECVWESCFSICSQAFQLLPIKQEPDGGSPPEKPWSSRRRALQPPVHHTSSTSTAA